MNILSVAAIGIISAVLALSIKKNNPEMALLISICAAAVIFVMLMTKISPVIQTIQQMMSQIGVSQDYLMILLKCLGICIITQLACDVCRDSGQTAISSQIELAGKMAILITALPLMLKLTQTAVDIMGS